MYFRVNSKDLGFTLVEIIVALGISSLIALSVIPLFVFLSGSLGESSRSAKRILSLESVESTIKQDLKIARYFYATSTADSSSPATSYWSMDGSGVNGRNLIIGTITTTAATSNPNRQVVYNTGGTRPCTVPKISQVVYYVSSGSLYRRSLPDVAVGCYSLRSYEVKSCLSGCGKKDIKLLDNVTKININYYSTSQDETAVSWTSISKTNPLDQKGVLIEVYIKDPEDSTQNRAISIRGSVPESV